MSQNTSPLSHGETELALKRLEAVARLMDSAVEIPGTGIRIGLDALIGLFPGIGDLASSAVSLYLVRESRRLGAPRWLVARMLWNVALDTAVGAVPVAGDAFDTLFRANLKNMGLLRDWLERRGRIGGGPIIDAAFERVSERARS